MKGTLVNLNVNPCKMCMPMGAVTALYGIKKCMSILHGSQGCSTYIRRHMATHFNEPVDIASSSLTEEGTVYGGEKNLLKGLDNLIKLYDPEVIGVATTCLAETIGEDIYRIINKFYEEHPEHKHITIIPVHSAGYAGSQYEGYMGALIQIVKGVEMDTSRNGKINVVTSQLSPADTRYLKKLLESFSLDYILLPDLSENLDAGYQPKYNRLPQGGTDIADIKRMAGAGYTIELSSFAGETASVGEYLKESFGVPYIKCNLTISLRDNDELLRILSEITGRPVPEYLIKERSRFLDAMIDAHKYNGEARAVIYGEPDFVYGTVRMCVENGIVPVIAATGSRCAGFKEKLNKELNKAAEQILIDRFEILEDIDFQTIEELAGKLGVNVLIGNSDGRRMAERLGIPLVRRSFPVHDRVGGQRLRTLGYEGALTFLDDISNVILCCKEDSFREDLYKKYYKEASEQGESDVTDAAGLKPDDDEDRELNVFELNLDWRKRKKAAQIKTATHPCYNCGAHQYARIHLPVAPGCNISCNYCVRKYDCPNESRPGVTTGILTPEEALKRYLEVKEKVPNLSVVGIAGPGDALANFPETMRTLELIRQQDREITFCLSTNGLMLPQYAEQLAALGVTHVTVTMNAVDPLIGARIYKYVDYMGVKYIGEAGAAVLLANQLAGIRMLTARGIMCKVNIVMIKGINDKHIPEVVKKVKELGVSLTNIMKHIPVEGSVFEDLPVVNNQELKLMRSECGTTLKQMYHCRQCRADAIGTLDYDHSAEYMGCLKGTAAPEQCTAAEADGEITARGAFASNFSSIQVAVATKSGMLVDQHFGQVTEFYVYEYINGNTVFKERRSVKKYCDGTAECDAAEDKMDRIIQSIADCRAVIAMRIGEAPREKLNKRGIRVFTTYDRIETSVEKAISEISDMKLS